MLDNLKSINIPMPSVNTISENETCENCNKKNVCKYKEHVQKVKEHIKTRYDDGWNQLPIKVDVECIEFSIGYTGVNYGK